MRRDVDVDFDIAAEAAAEPDRSRLREVFREYELRDPLRRLEEALGEAELAAPAPGADVTLTARVRSGTPAQIPGVGATGGKDSELCVAASAVEPPEGSLFDPAVADAQGASWRFAVAADGEALAGDCDGGEEVAAACGERPVVAHDAKALGQVPARLVHDTLLGAYLLEPARRGYPLAELFEERGLTSDIEDPLAAEAVLLGALADWQREQIAERGLEGVMHEIELPLVAVLRDMELAGVRLNVERLSAITARVREEIAGLEEDIFLLAEEEFTIASPQQLGEILFEKLGLSRKRRGKTGYSTDARVLQAIRDEHEIVPKIERWRELSTLIKTYLDVLPELVDGRSRIHTTFLQAVAQTGRLSSTNPNMQNVPIRTPLGREIRGCFEAEEGSVLISADYSQIELRVLAQAAGEQALMEIFARGEDVHTATASRVFGVQPEEIDPGMRSKSKMINYGIVYGLSDFGLADRLNIPREEAKEFIDAYLERFPKRGGVHRRDDRAGEGAGLRHDPLGPAPPDARAARPQLPGAHARRAPGREHRHPGNRRGHHQAGDGALPPRARALRAGDPPAADDPRRAAVRRAARRERGGARADRAGDVRGVGARAPDGRGRRRRRHLAGGEVTHGGDARSRATASRWARDRPHPRAWRGWGSGDHGLLEGT